MQTQQDPNLGTQQQPLTSQIPAGSGQPTEVTKVEVPQGTQPAQPPSPPAATGTSTTQVRAEVPVSVSATAGQPQVTSGPTNPVQTPAAVPSSGRFAGFFGRTPKQGAFRALLLAMTMLIAYMAFWGHGATMRLPYNTDSGFFRNWSFSRDDEKVVQMRDRWFQPDVGLAQSKGRLYRLNDSQTEWRTIAEDRE